MDDRVCMNVPGSIGGQSPVVRPIVSLACVVGDDGEKPTAGTVTRPCRVAPKTWPSLGVPDHRGGRGAEIEIPQQMADIETIHPSEGTMQELVVGRDVAGTGAFA